MDSVSVDAVDDALADAARDRHGAVASRMRSLVGLGAADWRLLQESNLQSSLRRGKLYPFN